MELSYRKIFSIKSIIVIICIFICASFAGHIILRKFYGEIFEKETELSREKGTGKLMQSGDGLYTYRIFEDTGDIIIICYNGALVNQETTVVIPDEIDGHIVTALDEVSIAYNEYIEKIILPKSLTTLRRGIGANCPNLKTIIFMGDDISLDDDALKYSQNTCFSGTVFTKKDSILWKYCKKNGIQVRESDRESE